MFLGKTPPDSAIKSKSNWPLITQGVPSEGWLPLGMYVTHVCMSHLCSAQYSIVEEPHLQVSETVHALEADHWFE